jgi:hypothetical protein
LDELKRRLPLVAAVVEVGDAATLRASNIDSQPALATEPDDVSVRQRLVARPAKMFDQLDDFVAEQPIDGVNIRRRHQHRSAARLAQDMRRVL